MKYILTAAFIVFCNIASVAHADSVKLKVNCFTPDGGKLDFTNTVDYVQIDKGITSGYNRTASAFEMSPDKQVFSTPERCIVSSKLRRTQP